MPNPTAAVRIRGLTRRFGTLTALDRLELDIEPGAFFALVGSNGAGKTTTLRILSCLIRHDAGTAEVFGHDLARTPDRVRRLIGVVPDFPILFDPLTARENLRRLGALRGLPRAETARRIDDLVLALHLDRQLDTPVHQLSQGTRKKAALAAAMLHAPRLLLLDEPFESIDPVAAHAIRVLLDELRRRGVTILLTSHVLPLVAAVATHVGILDCGHLVACGTLAEIVGRHVSLEAAVLQTLAVEAAVPALEWYAP